MKFTRLIQNGLQAIGYDILSLAYSQEYVYDRHLKKVLKQLQISTVLDIGANIGGYGRLLRSIGFRGLIHSFEPCSAPFVELNKAAAGDSDWVLHQIGIGNQIGPTEINIMAGSELSSLLQPRETSSRMSVVGTETIHLQTLDSLDLPIDWSKTFVKVDTQGYDSAVIEGGLNRLKQVPLLQTEVSFLPIYQSMPSFSEFLALLTANGFDLLGMYPVSRDAAGRVREFDCLCLNREWRSAKN
ncbi:MAG: FkbM family methyltransferase [Rhodoferax sp.]|uniref:FkbM family methyltransferase n=1 Tax=Rhodoferax sp. TaxID=50421 RepID=UPI0026048EBD|nr:FkbM family methyltransferase [Rhodoferax sp.]MDD2881517.1 FkbM family methyltransferase [Rhodoferax sp.]